MLVRFALADECETFVELSRMAVAESDQSVEFDADVVRETFAGYLDTADPTIFFVEQHGEVIGFLLATISAYRFARSIFTTQEVMFVRPDKRGSRAAALLVAELVRWSDALGARVITGGNDNGLFSEQTARLLERFGFERVGIFMRRSASDG